MGEGNQILIRAASCISQFTALLFSHTKGFGCNEYIFDTNKSFQYETVTSETYSV